MSKLAKTTDLNPGSIDGTWTTYRLDSNDEGERHREKAAEQRDSAPLGFGLLIEPMGRGVVAVSSLLSLGALLALLPLPRPDRRSTPAASPAQ